MLSRTVGQVSGNRSLKARPKEKGHQIGGPFGLEFGFGLVRQTSVTFAATTSHARQSRTGCPLCDG